MKSFKGKEDTRSLQEKYKCIGKKQTFSKHGDTFSNAYFVGTQFHRDFETFDVREYGVGAPSGHIKLQGTLGTNKETIKEPRGINA